MSSIDQRLADLGVTLPDAPAPAANYVSFVVSGGLVYVSGQISQDASGFILGKLGRELDVAAGAAAAKTCALALVAQAKKAAGGDLDRDPGGQAHRLRQLDAGVHRPAEGDQRRLGFPGGALRRRRAGTPARL